MDLNRRAAESIGGENDDTSLVDEEGGLWRRPAPRPENSAKTLTCSYFQGLPALAGDRAAFYDSQAGRFIV